MPLDGLFEMSAPDPLPQLFKIPLALPNDDLGLPDPASALLRHALTCLAWAEADPRYQIDMLNWHRPMPDGWTAVCLSGAVMAFALGVKPKDVAVPGLFNDRVCSQLLALDRFRVGDVWGGLDRLNRGAHNNCYLGECHNVTFYIVSPSDFVTDCKRLADWLQVRGL